jgi:BirA family biotin operon repressor/biotin-[acetyl-CoA-carboxylase] ligase
MSTRFAVTFHDVLASTSDTAKALAAAGAAHGTAICARRQTAGRGRLGRSWESPPGNLYVSIVLRYDIAPARQAELGFVAALAVADTIDACLPHGPPARLKWPNDVLLNGKKLAGILLELTGDPADLCSVAIGIGINVNMRSADGIDHPWTSLRDALGRPVDRNQLLTALNKELEWHLARHREQGFVASQREWESFHLRQGREVRLSTAAKTVVGRAVGIDEQGALLLDVDGVESRYSGGELSLRLSDDS